MKLKLINTIRSKLNSLLKNNGQIIVTRDDLSLHIDLNNERITITDWIDIDTESNLPLSPLGNKYYYVKDTNTIWRYINGSWVDLNSFPQIEIATTAKAGIVKPDGTSIKVDESGILSVIDEAFFKKYQGIINEADLDTFVNRKSGCYRVTGTSSSKLLLVFNQKTGSASGLEILTSWTLETFRIRGIIDSNRYTAWKDMAFLSSNVASATKLATARTINGVSFDGTKDINIPADDALDAASTNPVQNAVVTARLNECFQSVSEGKSLIASAITDKGVDTAADATFTAMASNIGQLGDYKVYYSGEFALTDVEHVCAKADSGYVDNSTWVVLSEAEAEGVIEAKAFSFTHSHNIGNIISTKEEGQCFVMGYITTDNAYGFRCSRGYSGPASTASAQYYYTKQIPFGAGDFSYGIKIYTGEMSNNIISGVDSHCYLTEMFSNSSPAKANYAPLNIRAYIRNNHLQVIVGGRSLFSTCGTLDQIKIRYYLIYKKL